MPDKQPDPERAYVVTWRRQGQPESAAKVIDAQEPLDEAAAWKYAAQFTESGSGEYVYSVKKVK